MYLVTYKSSRQITPNDFEIFSVNKLFNPDTTLKQIRDWKQETDRTTSVLMSEVIVSEILPPANVGNETDDMAPKEAIDVAPDKDLVF